MTSIEQTENVTVNDLLRLSNENQINELNNRLKNDFMSYCYSFVNDDNDTRKCVETVWNKYLQCVGDVAMLSSFFDTLPFNVKKSALAKYQNEINEWCKDLFLINSKALLCSTYYAETFQRVIRYAFNNEQKKQGIIYISNDFDPNLKFDLLTSISNIKFEQIPNENSFEDTINIHKLEEFIKRDINDTQAYPFMVIANAGSPLLGRCDELTKIKNLCGQYNIWLHVIGDLLGSLVLLSSNKTNLNLSCDSLTIDTMKLFGIQNLSYLTFYLNSTPIDNNNNSITSHSLYNYILHSPSISFLSIWSISQRCTKDTILYHMKKSFDLTKFLVENLKQIKTIEILNNDDNQQLNTYQRICSGDAPNDILPKSIVIFRFQNNNNNNTSDATNIDEFNTYNDLLNLWLFDKISQQYAKMNFELLKSNSFQKSNPNNDDNNINPTAINAFRFAPLEHLLDDIEQNDMQSLIDDIQRYTDILLATMIAHQNLPTLISKYENLISVPLPNWAGIGAVRYVPSTVNLSEEITESSIYEINTIQAELVRQLQTNDSAFSLGGGMDDNESMFYLRLGMIRKVDDLEVLLQKISTAGKETESSLKYVEDMATKIKTTIEQVQKDLYEEQLQVIAQEGLLRQLPVVSSLISWWSPAPSSTTTLTKGRSFDLNSGKIESTEDTYVYRMQVNKQSGHAPTHNDSSNQ